MDAEIPEHRSGELSDTRRPVEFAALEFERVRLVVVRIKLRTIDVVVALRRR